MKSVIVVLVLMLIILVGIFYVQINGYGGNDGVGDGTGDYNVNFTNERSCSGAGPEATCIDFDVECEKVVRRTGSLVLSEPPGNSKGTILLMSDGTGNKIYHEISPNHKEIVETLIGAGYRVVELFWTNERGIFAFDGEGAVRGFCAPAAVYKAFQEEFGTDEPLCAHGTSGGSLQLTYGLTFYDLGDLFDTVVLAGGPPVSSFTEGCNGIERNPELGFPSDLNIAMTMVDSQAGFMGANERYCKRANRGQINIYDFPEVVEKLDSDSLVIERGMNRNPKGVYDFPNTNLFFVESNTDETNADSIGRLYYDVVSAEKKEWIDFSASGYGRGGHNVPITDKGSDEIKRLLTENCV